MAKNPRQHRVLPRLSVHTVVLFLRRVDCRNGPDTCWPWVGSKQCHDYGQFNIGQHPYLSHRVMFAVATGRLVFGDLLHSCDTPACCNPSHLREGSARENAADMCARFRDRNGARWRNGQTATRKLCTSEVAAIRALAREGWPRKGIAQAYSITAASVGYVVRRNTFYWF